MEVPTPQDPWVSVDAVEQILKEVYPQRHFSKKEIGTAASSLNVVLSEYRARLEDHSEPTSIQLIEQVRAIHGALKI